MTTITSFKVSSAKYFVERNQHPGSSAAFDAKLVFDIDFTPQTNDDSWIEQVFADIRSCLLANVPTNANQTGV